MVKPSRFVASLVLVVFVATTASAATKEVAVGDRFFDPVRVKIRVGDSVHWTGGGSQGHNVREDHRIFYSGPRAQTIDYTLTFSAGTWHYFCETHGTRRGGMDGFVKVPVTIRAAPSGAPFKVVWASSATQTGGRFDVQFKIGSGEWSKWKTGTRGDNAVFGSSGQPVTVDRGTKYTFRARSRSGDDESRWSPVRSFVP